MTRAVLFDVDGVLVHGYGAHPELQQRWDENLLEDLGVDPDRFRREFIFDIFVKQVVTGRMSLLEALDRRLPGLGYAGSSPRFIQYWLSHDSKPNSELLQVVRELRSAGTSLYVATNQEHLRAQWLWMTLGFGDLFDDMFHSARIGITKPNPGFFEWIERRLGAWTEPPLFFDDADENVKAAQGRGWEAVLFHDVADCLSHPWIVERLGR